MSIQEKIGKFKSFFEDSELFVVGILVMVGVTAFGLGGLMDTNQNKAMTVESEIPEGVTLIETKVERAQNPLGQYVASKNGSKYHLPWCPGAIQMKEENKVWFDSKEMAEANGYAAAGNCKGL